MNRKILITGGAILIVAAGYVLSSIMGSPEEEKGKPEYDTSKYVMTDTVDYQSHKTEITAYGTVKPRRKIMIFSEVPGIMLETSKEFKTGNKFLRGDTLIKIDDREIKNNLGSLKSDLITSITNLLPDLKTDYTGSYDKWKKYLEEIELEGDLNEMPKIKNDKEKYFLANRGILKLYYNIKNTEIKKQKHSIVAPFSGTVTESNVDSGTLINVGQRLGAFSNQNNYELELSVNKEDLDFIGSGYEIDISSGTSGKTFSGKITRISDYIDPNTQSVLAYSSIYGDDLKEGMYMKADISGNILDSAFKLPRKSVINNQFVFTIEDSVLSREEINILKFSSDHVYITGPEENTVVVVQPLVDPQLGMKVKPVKEN